MRPSRASHMKKIPLLRTILLSAALIPGALQLSADVVETKNGARIVGKIVRITEGEIAVETTYAGLLAVKQSEVATFSTDVPVAIRLDTGTRMDGRVSATPTGGLHIDGTDGALSTTVDKIAASWSAGGKDPSLLALERHWAYEAAVDVTGKTGNAEQLGMAALLRATLKTPEDTLQFYSGYDRQEVDDTKSADQFRAGVDYQNNFAGRLSWYVRDEGGFDRVKDIELYNVAAAGLGYDVIKEPKQLLTLRAGLSFRYEGYRNPETTDVKSAGLDFGLAHELTLDNSKIVNRLSIVPAFDDFANYRLTHESFYEIPLAIPSWKLRLGVSNDYNSTPPPGLKEMDTAYFARLVLNWR
jgi:putative salt-induced outer membrane protein YdiY